MHYVDVYLLIHLGRTSCIDCCVLKSLSVVPETFPRCRLLVSWAVQRGGFLIFFNHLLSHLYIFLLDYIRSR